MSLFGIGSGDSTSSQDNRQQTSGAASPVLRDVGASADNGGVAVGSYSQLQTGGVRSGGPLAGSDQQIGTGNRKVTAKNAVDLNNSKGNSITINDSTPSVVQDALDQVAAIANGSNTLAANQSASLGDYFSRILDAQQQTNAQNLSQLASLSQPQQIPRLTLYIIVAMLGAAVLAIFALMHRR